MASIKSVRALMTEREDFQVAIWSTSLMPAISPNPSQEKGNKGDSFRGIPNGTGNQVHVR